MEGGGQKMFAKRSWERSCLYMAEVGDLTRLNRPDENRLFRQKGQIMLHVEFIGLKNHKIHFEEMFLFVRVDCEPSDAKRSSGDSAAIHGDLGQDSCFHLHLDRYFSSGCW